MEKDKEKSPAANAVGMHKRQGVKANGGTILFNDNEVKIEYGRTKTSQKADIIDLSVQCSRHCHQE